MATADQPLKKRKIPADFADYAPSPPLRRPSPSPPAPVPAPSFSPDEIMQKRRNRDEIRSLVDCYRKIRACVENKDVNLMPDLEQSYLALITASRGCSAVQLIVAELIPRYASYCPTALEAAAKVSMNMYNWSLSIITRGEDVDGIAFRTAKACILGLVEICCTASHEAPTSSVIQGICAAVFLNVLTFFISSFEGKDIIQIGCSNILKIQKPLDFLDALKQEQYDGGEPSLDKLFKLRALSLLCIFVSFPIDLLQACFELLVSGGVDVGLNKGLYFLNQVTSHLSHVVKTHVSEKTKNGAFLCVSEESVKESGANSLLNPGNQDESSLENSLVQSSNSFMAMAIEGNTSLRGFILSKYKHLSESLSSQVFSQLSSILDRVFGSVSNAVKEAECEQHVKDNHDSAKCVDSSGWEHESSGKDSGQFARPFSYRMDGTSIQEGDRFASVDTPRKKEDNFPTRLIKSKESTRDQLDLERKNQVDVLSSDFQKQGHNSHSLAIISPADVAAVHFPPQNSVAQSTSSSQIQWHFDGDAKSMDVIYASRQLWLSFLGHDASETSVRLRFEDFGPLEHFFFFPTKDFALVEYRNIVDAVKAREYMQRSTFWGGCTKIKFLDRGLGSRGAINGVAFGDSCHVYVGKVSSQQLKDEILHGLLTVGLSPLMITDLTGENALLLEFGAAEEAGAAIRHIRYQRNISGRYAYPNESWPPGSSHKDNFAASSQLLVRKSRASMGYEEPHFTPRPMGVSGFVSPAGRESKPAYSVSFANNLDHTLHMHNSSATPRGQVHQMNWTNTSSTNIYEVDSRKDERGFSVSMDLSFTEDPAALQSGERRWTYNMKEPHSFHSSSEQGGPVAPPPQPPFPPSSVHPAYHNVARAWDNSDVNISMGQTSMVKMPTDDNHNINMRPPVPYMPYSFTPISQFAGCPISSLPNIAPPPPPLSTDAPPPLPSSPPPLPLSHPPSIPPPPISPPPSSSADSLKMQTSVPCTRQMWQGVLSKSGIQFCTIYAMRENSTICGYTNSVSEPEEWPVRLDVTKRTDFLHFKANFSNTPPHKREVCRLLALTKGDQKGVQDFTSYLKQRECIGVIKIPAGKTMWARLLFILPYSADTCSMLSISAHPADCLIALVLPKEVNQE